LGNILLINQKIEPNALKFLLYFAIAIDSISHTIQVFSRTN